MLFPSATSRPVIHSFVFEHPAASPADAQRHFASRLSVETDPWDVYADLERGVRRIVVYGWGPACNVPHTAGVRLAALGFRVKELIGGLEYWRREGHAVEGTLAGEASLHG